MSRQIESEQQSLMLLDAAAAANQLTAGAVANIRAWLTDARYAEYVPQVVEHIQQKKWRELDDAFWTIIPFGTGGRRGKMYPIGSNAINDRTMGESAQGLAEYVRQVHGDSAPLSCAIAYDTRHRSRHFAELCAEIMVASGFKVYFLDGVRSTPECSLAVRQSRSTCGIMITASHNPPSDNAVKAYWSTGGQLLPPHDQGVIDRVMQVQLVRRVPFAEALNPGQVEYCQDRMDRAYHEALLAQSSPGPREIKIIYSPMHGVGAIALLPALASAGFDHVEQFAPHAEPNGDFPNVPGHVANPENPETFDAPIARARECGADLVISTDPDADRLGCAAPLRIGASEWSVFTGNQIAALLVDHVLETRRSRLTPTSYVAKTLVTTEMFRRIAESYGVDCVGDLLVGFKWIGGLIEDRGPAGFLFGAEESNGYLAGAHVRDKDAAVAALLIAELAANCKSRGQSLHEKLDALYWQFGCHLEKTVSKTMPGSSGMARMRELMGRLRTEPPRQIAGLQVSRIRDFERGLIIDPAGRETPAELPHGDMVILDLESEGNYVAIRPSGTEPKVKFYAFAYEPAEMLANLKDTKAELQTRLGAMTSDLATYADQTSDA